MKITRDEHSSFDVTTMIYKTFKELQVGSEYVSSPFVKVKSSLLLGKGLIVSSVRRQIVEAHKRLKIKRQTEISEMLGNPDQDTEKEDDIEFIKLTPVVDGRIEEIN